MIAPAHVACLMAPLLLAAEPQFGRAQWLRQHVEDEQRMLAMGNRLARTRVTGAVPVRQSAPDATTAWRPIGQEEIASLVPRVQRKPAYRVQVTVDFDGDGTVDVARLATAGAEGVVLVEFGGRRRPPLVAYRRATPFGAGEELYPAGARRLLFAPPETHMTLLLMRDGRPVALHLGG